MPCKPTLLRPPYPYEPRLLPPDVLIAATGALDDQSPARLLREGDIDEVGPEIIAAERAFLVGG